jgi:hypothetical protein
MMGQSHHDKEKNEAFAKALEGLYKMYPLPEYKYQKVRWQRLHDRETALRNALHGDPLFMIDIFAHKVPKQEIEAIHTLIYG